MNGIDFVIGTILEWQRQNRILTELEKDILSTFTKYCERPFDRKGAEQKIDENKIKYTDIFTEIYAAYAPCLKPFNQLTDDEIMNNLAFQLKAMCGKECEINFKNMYRSNHF